MVERRVCITYSSSLQFLSSDLWTQINSALSSKFPLKNLHWKPASGLPVRTIQQLDAKFVSLETLKEEGVSQVPLYLLERPLLNIYVVTCDDIEVYRTTVKKQIKDWHTSVLQHGQQEWVIIYVLRPDVRMNAGGLSKLRGTVLDKIKADFNVDKRDRCARLIWSTGSDSPAAWAEVMTKVKDGIISAFDSAVTQREDEIRRLESQRQMPGWNFCTYYLLKESLAISFEDMSLVDDAQRQYDDLDISFSVAFNQKNMLWFGKFIEPGPSDDSLPLLSVQKKPYRDMILANTISVFDFRIYFLARQCHLLGVSGRISELGEKVIRFLASLSQRMRKEALPQFFVESWVYSSSLSVLDDLDEWTKVIVDGKVSNTVINATKGQLLEIARHQLDKIGVRMMYLPNIAPFIHYVNALETTGVDETRVDETKSQGISNPDITRCLTDQVAFYEKYVKLTNRAIDMYAKAGRRKFALRLHGSLAALDLHRGRLISAAQIYSSLPAHYIPHRWSSLASYMVYSGVDIQRDNTQLHNRDWVENALTVVELFLDKKQEPEFLMNVEDRQSYAQNLMDLVLSSIETLETEMIVNDHPSLSLYMQEEQGRCASDRDGVNVDIEIVNNFANNILVDEISLSMNGQNSEQVKFTIDRTTLTPGPNKLTLFNSTPLSGLFVVDHLVVRISHLLLRWNHLSAGLQTVIAGKAVRKLVKFPYDGNALRVTASQPGLVRVGSIPQMMITISSGRNNVSSCTIKLRSDDVSFLLNEGTINGTTSATATFSADKFIVSNLNPNQTLCIQTPYIQTFASNYFVVTIEVEYATFDEPAILRQIKIVQHVNTALAIVINMIEIAVRLFSKFTISTTNHQHVRIKSADIVVSEEDASSLSVWGNPDYQIDIQTVTPATPVNYIFQMEHKGEKAVGPVELRLKYRLLREEIENLLSKSIKSQSLFAPYQIQLETIQQAILDVLRKDSTWVDIYEATGELHLPAEVSVEEQFEEFFSKLKENLQNNDFTLLEDGWNEVIIPVDLPHTDIVAATRLHVSADPFQTEVLPIHDRPPVFSGQPISGIISIHISFHWRGDASRNVEKYVLQYEVEEITTDWLISGRKRGLFLAKDNSIHKETLTMIPVRHGYLSFPRISVRSPSEIQAENEPIPSIETYQMNGAETIFIVPSANRTNFIIHMDEKG